ncbi:MAG: glycosyltransferase family 4 protein [Pyrinomonadaceae bacterium]
MILRIILYVCVILISYLGVEAFRRWSLRRNLYDVPNERSSHTAPTARGGGLIIVLICLSAYAGYTIFISGDFRWSYLLGASLIALVSWLDDLYSISFVWRILVHAAAAAIIILTLGYFQEIHAPFFHEINFGINGAWPTFFWIVWLTNAYNFMDGIDGIAGIQAVCAGIGWLLIGELCGLPTIGFYGGIIAFSSLGLTIQNWQPAKIFMGDVGSAFLGYSFAALPLLAKTEIEGVRSEALNPVIPLLPIIAVLAVWLFVFDTIYTFLRRVFRGEKVWQAHRSHIYQKLVIGGFSHQTVAIIYGAISASNILLLILWIKTGDLFGGVLIFWICLQSFGLLLFYHLRNRRNSFNL